MGVIVNTCVQLVSNMDGKPLPTSHPLPVALSRT